MSEGTENPGKSKGILGFVLSLVALLLGGTIMAWLFMAAGMSKGVAALGFLLPIGGIVVSVMGMKASKAAGHKNPLGLTGMIISIVGFVWLIMVFMGLSMLANAGGALIQAAEAAEALESLNHH